MKKLITILLFSLGSVICLAQTAPSNNTQVPGLPTGPQVSPNLVYTTVTPYQGPAGTAPYTWSGFTSTTSNGGGLTGGSQPGYNQTTGTFMFGFNQGTVGYTYALNTALKNSGMTWTGYNYSWDYINQGMTKGTLSAKVGFTGTDGTSLYSKTWSLGATDGWKTVSGTESFTDPLAVANINSFNLSFSGKDDRFWAGYYGPQVKNISMSINYTFDACSSNPLSNPSCPGYAAALKTQQCNANPLYDSSCPGYSTAYKMQQCAANPLYDTTCPGYAAAYKTQQCTLDPLYDTTCPGYAQAYKSQQCSLNPLYDTTCSGYATAYKAQQCSLNPLYATDCPGYDQAYLNAQCIKDSLYSTKCEGYATAYAIKYLVNLNPAVTTAVNQQLTTNAEIAKTDPAKVTVVSATVDSVTSTPTTTSATSTSPTSVTSVVNQPPPPPPGVSPVATATTAASAPPPPPPPAKQEERQQEQRKTDTEVAKVENKTGGDKDKAKQEVGQKARDVARDTARAKTIEAQIAGQGLLVGLMGYVPGFSAYQVAVIQDTNAMEMARKYSKPVVDNARAQRRLSGANETRWKEMVDSQYNN